MKNLREDYLYSKIPEHIITEDVRTLLRAVMGGLQDRVSDLRAIIDQVSTIYVPDNSVGEPYKVVVVKYIDDMTEEDRETTLNQNESTPDENRPYSDLAAWCSNEAEIPLERIVSIERTTSEARTAETRTIIFLAETFGAKLYDTILEGENEKIANQKRALKNYFAALKVKGTGKSFEILGKLHGFDDVKFTPLWGRLSPRNPANVGSKENDQDFSYKPQGVVTPGVTTNLYNPEITNDGDLFIWTSSDVGIDESKTDYILLAINGTNPYINVVKTKSDASIPATQTKFLKGGTHGIKASTGPLLGVSATDCGFEIQAIADGNSFNSAQVQITNLGEKCRIVVYHNLSAVKFATSYFNIAACASYSSYGASATRFVKQSEDLKNDPALWKDLIDAGRLGSNYVPFANSGIALDPYRFWYGGSIPQPVIYTWPDFRVVAGTGTSTERYQAPVDVEAIDLDQIKEGHKRLLSKISDVKPATRHIRNSGCGLSISSQALYAPHVSKKMLDSSVGNDRSIGVEGIDYPTKPFTGSMSLHVALSKTVSGFDPVIEFFDVLDVDSETRPDNEDIADFKYVYTEDDNGDAVEIIRIEGSINYSTATYSITVCNLGATHGSTTWSAEIDLFGNWQAIGTDRLQNEPGSETETETYLTEITPLPKVANVNFNPPNGSEVAVFPVYVLLSHPDGAPIKYAIDADPTISGTSYSGGLIEVQQGETLYAYGLGDGVTHSDGDVTFAAYPNSSIVTGFEYIGETSDEMGTWSSYWASDGALDNEWRLTLSLSTPKTIQRIELYQTNALGIWNSGQAWATNSPVYPARNIIWTNPSTDPDTPFSIFGLGVKDSGGTRINVAHGEPVLTVSGSTTLTLKGTIALRTLGYFRVFIFFTDGYVAQAFAKTV